MNLLSFQFIRLRYLGIGPKRKLPSRLISDGDRANVETYCVASHRLRGEPTDWLAGVRYVDVFERRDEQWRIFDRTVVFDWSRRADGGQPFEAGYLLGSRNRSDAVYRGQ